MSPCHQKKHLPARNVQPNPICGIAGALADIAWKGKSGFADGADVDADGNVWAGVGWVGDGWDGIRVFAPNDGALIGVILLPEICANCVFGGSRRNRLFMAASRSLYAVYVNPKARTPPPFVCG